MIVFADVHFAEHRKAIAGLMEGMLNPHDALIRLINNVNNSPDVVGVVNNGTTLGVDWLLFFRHIWKGYSRKKEANWRTFYTEIDRLNKEYYEVPGNHPHQSHEHEVDEAKRVIPTHFGEHELTRQIAKKSIGLSGATVQTIGAFRCVFLNTGPDPLARPKHWGKYAKKLVYGKKVTRDCEGLTDTDPLFVRSVLENSGRDTTYIFLHCPIINSKKSHIGTSYQLDTKNFLRSTAKKGIGYDVILNGGGELLETIAEQPKNVVIITSHTYIPKYYLIEKRTLIAKEVSIDEFNEELNHSIFIKHLNTPCLGVLYKDGRYTGYLSITSSLIREVGLHDAAQKQYIDADIKDVVKDSNELRQCLEKHRNLFVKFESIVVKERRIFEDIRDELQKMESLFDEKGKEVNTIIGNLDKRITHSLNEYARSHETELKLLRSSLSAVHKEYDLYEELIPKVQAVFRDVSLGQSDKYEGVKSVFFEWYTGSIQGVRDLSHKILYKENLFDNIEKKIIREIHNIIKGSKMTKKTRFNRLKKVKDDIDKVSQEIDCYFLNIPKGDKKTSLTLYSISEEAKKTAVFLDTVIRILEDFTKVFDRQSVQHKGQK